jgi:riboflavin biosynthesis pyrimidine reductase
VSSALLPLAEAGPALDARAVVASLRLHEPRDGVERPRVLASMIASVDGRVAVRGRSVALGHPADRAMLRELRASVDAILVGAATLRAERYANLLDPDQRERRAAAGLPEHPIVATISRSLSDALADVPIMAEPGTPVHVYSEAPPAELPARGARVSVHRFDPGGLTPAAVLEHLAAECGVRTVLCEGGPRLLALLVANGCLDDLLFTLSPLLIAGDAAGMLAGPELDPPRALRLRAVRRAADHLLLHYEAPR